MNTVFAMARGKRRALGHKSVSAIIGWGEEIDNIWALGISLGSSGRLEVCVHASAWGQSVCGARSTAHLK